MRFCGKSERVSATNRIFYFLKKYLLKILKKKYMRFRYNR